VTQIKVTRFQMIVLSSIVLLLSTLGDAWPTTSKGLDFEAALSTDNAAEDIPLEEVDIENRVPLTSTARDNAATNILSPFSRPDFDDFDGRLNDSFFKYVIRTDNYDKNEVPWAEGGKPVKVQMSAYLR
jgi:hypothetical protein